MFKSKQTKQVTIHALKNQMDILLKIRLGAPLGWKSYSIISFRDVNTHDVCLRAEYYLREDDGDFLLASEPSIENIRKSR